MENQKTNFDLGIVNADNQYTVQEEEQFSHQVLVMSAMRKCLEAGSREMVEGYFNTRADRSGNIIKTYVDDTRKAYIESVKSFRDILSC
ncbi:MAG TPA: hypothetical protein VMZ91_12115, partial [Candidatus Paceibacterota bacterium]|nr:hypothetical protein [Candidatus Paceibacterota bacterium]